MLRARRNIIDCQTCKTHKKQARAGEQKGLTAWGCVGYESRSALTLGCILSGTTSLKALPSKKQKVFHHAEVRRLTRKGGPTCAHGVGMRVLPGHIHNARMTNQTRGRAGVRTWLNWIPPFAAPKSLVVVSFKKRTPAQPGTHAVRQCAGKTGEVQSSKGRAGNLCTCRQSALVCPPFPRSCIKKAEEHGYGPSTLHSFRPAPSEPPHTPLETACACVFPCPPKPQLSAKAMTAKSQKKEKCAERF